MRASDIPNLISILRIALVFPIAMSLVEGHFTWALALFALAGTSDGLDGFLAKRFGWTSRLGSALDPIADKLLLVSSYIVCGWLTLIPAWLVAAVIIRDMVIVTGAFLFLFISQSFEGRPSLPSKINTLLQILLLLAVMFSHGVKPLPEPFTEFLVFAVFVSTAGSGAYYVYLWGRPLSEQLCSKFNQ